MCTWLQPRLFDFNCRSAGLQARHVDLLSLVVLRGGSSFDRIIDRSGRNRTREYRFERLNFYGICKIAADPPTPIVKVHACARICISRRVRRLLSKVFHCLQGIPGIPSPSSVTDQTQRAHLVRIHMREINQGSRVKVERWTLMSRQRIPEIIADEMCPPRGCLPDVDNDLVYRDTKCRKLIFLRFRKRNGARTAGLEFSINYVQGRINSVAADAPEQPDLWLKRATYQRLLNARRWAHRRICMSLVDDILLMTFEEDNDTSFAMYARRLFRMRNHQTGCRNGRTFDITLYMWRRAENLFLA